MAVIAYRQITVRYRIHTPDQADRRDFERELTQAIHKVIDQDARQKRHRVTFVDDVQIDAHAPNRFPQ